MEFNFSEKKRKLVGELGMADHMYLLSRLAPLERVCYV